jgi:nucleotide-binding universal stress UspA family protein
MAFTHIIAGVDGSDESMAAVAQAARLAAPETELVLAAYDEPESRVSRRDALTSAMAVVPAGQRVESVERSGMASDALVESAGEEGADLVSVGSHGVGRIAGILIGSVVTNVLHRAPCSVLVARPSDADPWPRAVLVGVDGSDPSVKAYEAAASLASRFDVALRPLVSIYGQSGYELEAARAAAPGIETQEANAVEALVHAASEGDLIVVGSRGLRGVKALGSVSERVAHEASTSVLVVRGT